MNPWPFARIDPPCFFRKVRVRLYPKFLIISWLVFFPPQMGWTKDLCPPTDSVQGLKQAACLAECEAYYVENPKARPSNLKGICDSTTENLLSFANPERNLERFKYCSKGVWRGVLNLPEQFKLFFMTIQDIGKLSKEHQDFLKTCDKDPACRVEAARLQAQFRDRNPNGSYKVSDEEVLKQVRNEDIFSLMARTQQHKDALSRTCQSQLITINRAIETASGFNEWDLNALQQRYRKLYQWDPYCPTVLKFDFPTKTGSGHQGAEWLAELGVKYQCISPDKINDVICFEIAKFVLDPINLVGGAGGLGAKALNKLGVGYKIERAATEFAERRSAQIITRKNKYDPRLPPRDSYIGRNLDTEVTTYEQNSAWIEKANSSTLHGSSTFLEVENTKMKFLNDTIKDKNLVTSMTNRYKELMDAKIAAIERKNPGLKIQRYSDFKSVRFAFDGKVPSNIEDQIQLAFQQTNKQFSEEIQKFKIVRASDKPESWFRAGYGRTADEASALARAGRETAGEGRLIRASDPKYQEKLSSTLKNSETLRKNLENKMGGTKLMTGSTGTKTPSREVFELVRKAKSDKDLALAIEKHYQIKITENDAKLLNSYSGAIDPFSPSLRIAHRDVHNLDNAVEGGFTADFNGLGAGNSFATAEALAGKSDVTKALQAARSGEKKMTQELRGRMAAFKRAVDDMAKCSGDDCVGIAKKALSNDDKIKILNRLAADSRTRGIRVAFVNKGVNEPAHRTLLSTHGEAVEKALRQELSDVLPPQRTTQMTFGIDMKTNALNKGNVDVLIGTEPGKAVSAKEAEQIREALSKAVQKVNQQLSEEGISSSYRALP